MAQTLGTDALTRAYLKRVQNSHDFRTYLDVLDLNENQMGTARLIDGQVNINAAEPRRTCSFTAVQDGGSLSFSQGVNFSGTAIWASRLVRVRHVVTVPGFGEVTTVPFIGPPTALSRSGGVIQVECADKSALASAGCTPLTAPAGMLATSAIKYLLSTRTGENRFRIPTLTRTLSRAYSVGYDDAASPWAVARSIAYAELGQQLIFSNDGYVTLRPTPTTAAVDAGYVTQSPDTAIDFTQVKNFVTVTGATPSVKATAQLNFLDTLSSVRLSRNGVPILWPLAITESGYTTLAQAQLRANRELAAASVAEVVRVTVLPLFHLDVDDMVTVRAEGRTALLRLSSGSIPLGVGDGGSADMTIGYNAWKSKRSTPRALLARRAA